MYTNPDGYILRRVPSHPYADSKGYVEEHRLVMESLIGRYLLPEELVHHKDENPSNNDPDNLEIMTRADHARHHRIGYRKEFCVNGHPKTIQTVKITKDGRWDCRLCAVQRNRAYRERVALKSGLRLPRPRLSAEDVLTILQLRDHMSAKDLARMFGKTRSAIRNIYNGKTWANIQRP